jgi:hypothetical protein
MDVRLQVSPQAAVAGAWAGALVLVLLSDPPEHFCSDCAVAITGKGCMRSPRLRRGRSRRRRQRHGGSRERGPPDDGDGDGGGSGDGPPRAGALFAERRP